MLGRIAVEKLGKDKVDPTTLKLGDVVAVWSWTRRSQTATLRRVIEVDVKEFLTRVRVDDGSESREYRFIEFDTKRGNRANEYFRRLRDTGRWRLVEVRLVRAAGEVQP